MPHPALEALKTDEFAMECFCTSNPDAVHAALQRSNYVEGLRSAIESGQISDEAIRSFIQILTSEFERGRRFSHELALAAIAVALENSPTPFADEYIGDLSRLRLAEIPIASRVASKSYSHSKKLSGSKSKYFVLDVRFCVHRDTIAPRQVEPCATGEIQEFQTLIGAA